jgi:SMC interacting uncharacterized protein involved in chromosome segregation
MNEFQNALDKLYNLYEDRLGDISVLEAEAVLLEDEVTALANEADELAERLSYE